MTNNYENEQFVLLTMKAWKWEVRKKKVKDFFKSIPQTARKVWNNDKEMIMFLTPGVIYGVRRLTKHNDEKKEAFHRDCQIFDHSLGMWHDLRRPMKAKEKELFAKRKKAGESTLSILTSMGLLKR